jgi:hypothetical protein
MPLEPHSELSMPPDDTILWRYIDLSKLLYLLEHRSLWFPRADQFEDPLEGTFTDAEIEHLRTLDAANSSLPSPISRSYLRGSQYMRSTAYVNCWRAGRSESMAMWDLYGRDSGTVAMKTTVGLLKQAIAASAWRTFLASVTYVDWDSAPFDNNSLVMCFRKDASYEYENEVRAVIWDPDLIGRNMSDALEEARSGSGYPAPGVDPFLLESHVGELAIEMPFDPEVFVTEIVVGPRESSLNFDLLQRVLGKYSLKTKLTKSDRLTPRS